MLFNSLEFILFFFVFFILYWSTQKKLRLQNLLILIGSYLFYAWWDWRFLSLIIISSLVDYILGLRISRTDSKRSRKILLSLSLITNLGLLGIFKYFNFFIHSFTKAFASIGIDLSSDPLNIILPIGISFYTFQTLSYTFDIYRNQLKPTKSVIDFFAFVSFFPQFVAGPIIRAKVLIPQLQKNRIFENKMFIMGMGQILVGYCKKVIIADNIAAAVDPIFFNPSGFSELQVTLGVFLYGFQIYCDFSGYSDIAIGLARTMGFNFPMNFNMPYISKNFSEFWKRWHISLSSWLKDYLYIPLGGNRKGELRTHVNIMMTMLLGGLWHGANWTFVFWGGLHGLYLVIQKHVEKMNIFNTIKNNFMKWIITSLQVMAVYILVNFAWIFFRSKDFTTAKIIIGKIINISQYSFVIVNKFIVVKALLLTAAFIIIEQFSMKLNMEKRIAGNNAYMFLYPLLFIAILLFGIFDKKPFIYFQF